MKKSKNISTILYVLVFIFAIALIGIISCKNLINFYVYDEVDYNEWTAELGNEFETDIATTFFEKIQFVNINGAFRRLLGQRQMNGVIKLNNGYLFTIIDNVDDETLQGYADNVAVLDRYLENRGTKLIYAITPYTSGKYDPQLPTGVSDYGNDAADRLVSKLEAAGISTIDFRETMHADDIDHYEMMYKTDHHWTTEAGLYAYGVLADRIAEDTGCKVDEKIADITEYTVTKYPAWHLGSRGQRTGRYFAGIDDFDLIIPNFETSIQNDEGNVGTMQDLAINMETLEKKDYSSRYTYDLVLANSLGHYQNLDCENDLKLLLVTDSFGRAVAPYLIMGFSEIDYVSNSGLSSMTPEYIEAYDPDIVILLYYTENAVGTSQAYDFQGF